MLKLQIPKDEYVAGIDILEEKIEILTKKRQKVAMVMVCLGENYWPYMAQCLNDCKKHFLLNHKTDYFVWTDFSEEKIKSNLDYWKIVPQKYKDAEDKEMITAEVITKLSELLRNQQAFNPNLIQEQFSNLNNQGIYLTKNGLNYELRTNKEYDQTIQMLAETAIVVLLDNYQKISQALKKVNVIQTDAAPWPMPTLMRYHLFLQQEEKLKDYDYIFYLDADSRVVNSIPDEILGEGLTCAPHPGYVIDSKFIPPYEPNKDSAAYMHKLHFFRQENGKRRLIPMYAAGGFQGGTAVEFIKSMKEIRKMIDHDLNINYTAVWNDESHWNKYLWSYQEDDENLPITFLDVSYVMPDSLIKEYYEPLWGRSYEAKIVSLTKPWTLQVLNPNAQSPYMTNCPTCGDQFQEPNIEKVITCSGKGQPHQVQQRLGL